MTVHTRRSAYCEGCAQPFDDGDDAVAVEYVRPPVVTPPPLRWFHRECWERIRPYSGWYREPLQ